MFTTNVKLPTDATEQLNRFYSELMEVPDSDLYNELKQSMTDDIDSMEMPASPVIGVMGSFIFMAMKEVYCDLPEFQTTSTSITFTPIVDEDFDITLMPQANMQINNPLLQDVIETIGLGTIRNTLLNCAKDHMSHDVEIEYKEPNPLLHQTAEMLFIFPEDTIRIKLGYEEYPLRKSTIGAIEWEVHVEDCPGYQESDLELVKIKAHRLYQVLIMLKEVNLRIFKGTFNSSQDEI